MAGMFEVYEDKAGTFRFRLKAGNGEVVAQGEAYESRDGAHRGCEAVQRTADCASIKDLKPNAPAAAKHRRRGPHSHSHAFDSPTVSREIRNFLGGCLANRSGIR